MLDIMRHEKHKKIVHWILLLCLTLTMAVFFVPGIGIGTDTATSWAAKIDGETIPMQEYLDTYRRVRERLRQTKRDKEVNAFLPQMVLQDLRAGKIRESLAKRFGIEVTAAEVEQGIQSFQSNGQFVFQYQGRFVGKEYYKAMLHQSKLTPAEFEEGIYHQLLEKKLRDILTDHLDATITDHDLREEFSHTNQKTQVDYVLLKKADYKKRVKPTEADLKSYFEAHPDLYRIEEKRRAQFLVIPNSQFASDITVSDQEITSEWNKMPHYPTVTAQHILFAIPNEEKDAEVKAKAEEVLQRAKKGENFFDLAKKYSEDKQSADKGGLLPAFPKVGIRGKEFDNAAFSLKPQEISGLVRSEKGYHIIKVLDREEPKLNTEKRTELTATIKAKKAHASAKQKADEAILILQKQKDFNQAIGSLGIKASIKEVPPITKADLPSDLGISQPMRDALFEMKEINSIGKPVESNDGYAIPKLTEIQAARPGDLAAFRKKVEQDFSDIKSKDLLQADAIKLSEEAKKLGSLEKAAKGMGQTVKKSQEFALEGTPDPDIGTSLNKAAFALELGGISTPQTVYENMAVFQVKSRTPIDELEFQKKKEELRNKLADSLKDPYFQDYFQKAGEELEKKGKIRENPKAFEMAARIN
jgi:peptidyl-prolyl cis-trans isomerase D